MVQQRDKSKAKRAGASAASARDQAHGGPRPESRTAAKTARAADVAALSRRIAELERDLSAARGRVSELEALREQALNRIDWAIDSLQNVIEDES